MNLRPGRRGVYAIVFILSLLVSFLLYGNSIGGAYVFDDEAYVINYLDHTPQDLRAIWFETLVPGSSVQGVYRPLTLSSFWLNALLFGDSPVSFHVINIVLHGLCVFLVFVVLFQLFADVTLAAIAAALFAVIPIHTEAVAYIKARDEVLSTFFFLLGFSTLLLSNKIVHRKIVLFFVTSFFFALSALSKDFAIAWPVVAFAVYWFRYKPRVVRFLTMSSAVIVLPVSVLGLRVFILGARAFGTDVNYFVINPLGYTDTVSRVSTAFRLAYVYISKTFVPLGLSATYHYNHIPVISHPFASPDAIAGMILLAGLLGLLFIRRIWRSPVMAGLLFFLLPYSIFSKFIYKWGDMAAERWMYFPSLGLLLLAAFGLKKLLVFRKRTTYLLLSLLLVFYSGVTILRNRVWHTKLSLAESMLASAPNSVMSYQLLVNAVSLNGDIRNAKRYADAGMAIYADHPPLLEISAGIEYKAGNYVQAKKMVEAALRGKGRLVAARILQVLLLAREGKYKESLATLDRYLKQRSNDKLVRFAYAITYYKLGQKERAREYFDWDPKLSEAEKISILEEF